MTQHTRTSPDPSPKSIVTNTKLLGDKTGSREETPRPWHSLLPSRVGDDLDPGGYPAMNLMACARLFVLEKSYQRTFL
jgi:hypothetical protein